MTDQTKELPSLPDDECIVHIYPSDLDRMARNECTATAFSVAVGCPDERSVPLYTSDQMREYARAALKHAQQAVESEREKALEEAATICDELSKLYTGPFGFDEGYSMASKRAASEIRALKSQQPAQADKPRDCSNDPSSCPDNEGRGCYCTDNKLLPCPSAQADKDKP